MELGNAAPVARRMIADEASPKVQTTDSTLRRRRECRNATQAVSQATLLLHQPKETADRQPASSPAPKPARVVAVVAVVVLIAAWFAPAFVARSSLRHRLVHIVFPSYPGEVSVGRASLGWAAPVVLEDVVLRDVDGKHLLHIAEFRTSKNLFPLIARRSQGLGTLTLAHPRLEVRLKVGGSNFEETLRPLLEESGNGSAFTVLVTDGEVGWTAIDGESPVGGLYGVSATVEQGEANDELKIELQGEVSDGEHRGTIALRTERVDANGGDRILCLVQDLPLGSLQPWLNRFEAGFLLTGTGSADLVVSVPRERNSWTFDGRIAARRLRFSLSGSPERDTVLVEEAALTGKAFGSGSRLTVEEAELHSELLDATASGTLDLARFASPAWLPCFAELLDSDLSLHGTANLARVAAALPEGVRLRQPVQSGTVSFDMTTSEEASQRRGVLQFNVSDLISGPAERPMVWQQPLAVALTMRKSEAGLLIDQAKVESEFLQVSGSGSASGATLDFSTDLDRLRTLLTRFIDLPARALTGRAKGRLTAVRDDAEGPLAVTANATIRDWQIATSDGKWSERELLVEGFGQVAEVPDGYRIESGHFSLKSVEGDEARVELRAPARLSDFPFGSVTASARGSSRRWYERAGALNLLPSEPAWSIDGEMDASADVAASPSQVRAKNLRLTAKQFRLATPSQTFDESYLNLAGDMVWDRAAGELSSASAKLDCESAAVVAKDMRWSLETMAPLSGHFELRGGVGRLARYVMPARPPVWFSGVVAGTLDVRGVPQATEFDAAFDFERPLVTTPTQVLGGTVTWVPVWSDEAAHVALAGRYHMLSDRLDVTSLQLASSGMKLAGKGHIDQLSQTAHADLTGTMTYDWPEFAKRVPAWPLDVVARGKGTQPFVVRGPLLSVEGVDPAFFASLRVNWESLDARGIKIGRGELAARMQRRSLTLGPFETVVANGRVGGSATMPFAAPWPLRIAPGKLIENVELSPELCRQWLRYATPMLADATTVQGKASLGVAACVVPLAAPAATEGEATLLLQNLDATPGPVARSLIDVVGQVQRIAGGDATNGSDLRLVAPQQSVAVRMTNGRVFHDRFAVQLGDADGPTVTTSGSVGLDETLDLVVTVPLDAKWFKDPRTAAALGGQLLRIPVRGTLSKPAPDPRVIQDFARRAATGAVNGILNREIEKQIGDPLKKLLQR